MENQQCNIQEAEKGAAENRAVNMSRVLHVIASGATLKSHPIITQYLVRNPGERMNSFGSRVPLRYVHCIRGLLK